MAKDPVCGMEVDEAKAPRVSMYGGHKYYFCSDACKKAFDENPSAYVAPADARPQPSSVSH